MKFPSLLRVFNRNNTETYIYNTKQYPLFHGAYLLMLETVNK